MAIAVTPQRRNRNSILLATICCCPALLLFAIAATIVVALIPIYLPRRDGGTAYSVQGPPQQVTYSLPSNTTFPNGPLTQTQLAYLVGHYQTEINNNQRSAGSTISSLGATITSSTNKRKRQTTVVSQFLTFIYQIQFRPGTTVIQRNQITIIINTIIRIPIDNFNFLLTSLPTSQTTLTAIPVTTPTISTGSAINTTVSTSSPINTTISTSSPTSLVDSTTSTSDRTLISGYDPVAAACPNGPFLSSADALFPEEASWLQQRTPKSEASLRSWLTSIGLDANDFNGNTTLPRVALATSGGGYRSLLTGAGVIQAFDGREESHKSLLSGLLQGMTYHSGASGGAWLVTSFAVNNYPTISSLRDSLWIQRFQYFLISVNPVQPEYDVVAVAQVVDKKEAGFNVTAADVWARLLAFQLIDAPDGGPNVTFDQITSTDAFQSFSLPFPIVTTIQLNSGECEPPLNGSQYEFTPYAFGSWDAGIRAFTPIKFLGTNYTNSQPANNQQCIIGFDNAAFILGTSSFLFNVVQCRLLPNNSMELDGDPENVTGGIINRINGLIQGILNDAEESTRDHVLSAVYPNPFYGYTQSPQVSSLSQLRFVDGGETHQNIPFWPLIQPARKVDVIFANDNSADTDGNFPNGTEIMTTYMQAQLNGLPFPFIPDVNTFVSQGLNVRPTFFGCNETNVPLVIYIPNTNISFPSGISTFQPTYTEAETRGLIQNGFNLATRSNSTQWARCVACAIARRITGLYTANTSVECRNCFDTYCFKTS